MLLSWNGWNVIYPLHYSIFLNHNDSLLPSSKSILKFGIPYVRQSYTTDVMTSNVPQAVVANSINKTPPTHIQIHQSLPYPWNCLIKALHQGLFSLRPPLVCNHRPNWNINWVWRKGVRVNYRQKWGNNIPYRSAPTLLILQRKTLPCSCVQPQSILNPTNIR